MCNNSVKLWVLSRKYGWIYKIWFGDRSAIKVSVDIMMGVVLWIENHSPIGITEIYVILVFFYSVGSGHLFVYSVGAYIIRSRIIRQQDILGVIFS